MSPCSNCQQPFEVSDFEHNFHQKIGVPAPRECPDCRLQRRVAFRNESKFYKRESDFSKKNIISLYSPEQSYKVYEIEEWFSDKWDPLEYGRDFDFNRSFFEQWHELYLEVPKPNLAQLGNENSSYSTGTGYCKNCYFINSSEYSEDCYYGKLIQNSKNVVDSSYVYDSELLFECFNVRNCYHCVHVYNSQNSSDCWFSDNVNACRNCFLCTNLNQKEYYFLNKPLSKEEYQARIREFHGYNAQQKALELFRELRHKNIVKYANILAAENCSGDFIRNSKNCQDCYDVNDSEDSKYLHVGVEAKNLLDCSNMYIKPEFCYQTMGVIGTYNVHFCVYVFHSNDVWYSEYCYNCKNLFGCAGLRNKQYCILNKQYSKEEYEKIIPKIIEQMQKNDEWGEFFPMAYAPFCYNETLAFEYFPMEKEVVLTKGWRWKEEDSREYLTQSAMIPNEITEVPEAITSEILACEKCRKNYRIIEPELQFYRQMNLPIPHICPDCRHRERMQLRNPRKLWDRNCSNCRKAVRSTYAPDRPETVYCEECYVKAVF